jgi:hypothetical protein
MANRTKDETMLTETLPADVATALAEFEALKARIGEVADARGELLDHVKIDQYIEAVGVGLRVPDQKRLAIEIGINIGGLGSGRRVRGEIGRRLRRWLESYQRTRF